MTAVRITKEDTANDHTFTPRTFPAPAPIRTFDLRTSEERLVMWCAHLEMGQEALAERITHLELAIHRILNGTPAPASSNGAQPAAEDDAGDAAAEILAYLYRDSEHDPVWALDLLRTATPHAVYCTLCEDTHTQRSAMEIEAGYHLLIQQLKAKAGRQEGPPGE